MRYKVMRVFALYDGKVVDMTSMPEKQRFHLACCRVTDNAKSGYVVEGNNVYVVSHAFKSARIVRSEEARSTLLAMLP